VTGFTTNAPPAPVNVTIQTNPANLPVEVDGQIINATQTILMTPGTQHSLRASAPTAVGGTRQAFSSWSDGGTTAARSFTVPGASSTLTASFLTQHLLTLNVGPNGTASASPASPGGDGFYNAATPVTITAVPNGGFTTSFTGTDSASGNTGTLTMNAPRTVAVSFATTTSAPFTYSTSGVFLCTAGGFPGCNTNTIIIGDVMLAFVGITQTASAPATVPLGAIATACVGGGTGCAITVIPPGIGLQVQLLQSIPSAGNGTFTSTIFGSIGGTASSASTFFNQFQSLVPRPGGVVNYTVINNPTSLAAPATNGGVTPLQLSVTFQ
jgi:hypothetical protein